MRPQDEGSARLARFLVSAAARLVPAGRRSEWHREWDAELWVAEEEGRRAVKYALGSFRHALWIRSHAAVEAHRQSTRASGRWLFDQIRFSWLDVKLGLRMLVKQPGLTLVAIFALAIGIPVGLLPLHVVESLTRPLPVEDGEEIVMVRNYDRASSRAATRSLHDFVQWRQELSSFEDLGMWREDLHNVNAAGGRAAPVRGAEVTASVFSLLRIAPLLGRPLTEADEVIGAPDVVVIGYDLWQSRLAGDPEIVGSTIRIGAVPHTVVGVMPDGYLFPFRDHLWLPFRYDPLAYETGAGPSGRIMGRIADGVSIEEARREIESFGRRMAGEFPETHAQLQPQILPYTRALTGMDSPDAKLGVLVTQILAFLLLTLACGNVGVLVLARVASRTGEIAIRTALGASRLRILSQLFIESLVLAVLAAGAGLLILQAVATGPDYLQDGLPFWVDFEVSLRTALVALSLAVVSAVLAGVVPALKATGKRVQASIQGAAGGGSGIRFGKGYSVLIVGEVAVALWFLVLGAAMLPAAVSRPVAAGIQADQYLFAALRIPRVEQSTGAEDSDRSAPGGRVAVAHEELVRRLAAEPGIGPVAIADALPGMSSHASRYIQVEGLSRDPRAPAPAWPVNVANVDVGFFDALGQPILSGRSFNTGDLGEDRSAVIVNTSFVERVLGGRNALGRRIRYWTPDQEEPSPWSHEIVGVVESLGMNPWNPDADQGLYHAVAPGELHPVSFAVRVGSDPERFTNRLRSIVSGIDPDALVQNPVALSNVPNPDRRVIILWTYLITVLAGIALVLSAACLYALVSFTVSRRTRECAIRAALGAQPLNIVSQIGKRVFLQLSTGAVIGIALSAIMLSGRQFESAIFRTSNWPVMVGAIALFVMVVGMLACVKPTLRAIRIRPAEVLKG